MAHTNYILHVSNADGGVMNIGTMLFSVRAFYVTTAD